LWQALTAPEFTQRYWLQTRQISDWKPGAAWRAVNPEDKSIISGEIIEIEPPKKWSSLGATKRIPKSRRKVFRV
jgi:uncharacterized protein YndB with AHSA1/START domain